MKKVIPILAVAIAIAALALYLGRGRTPEPGAMSQAEFGRAVLAELRDSFPDKSFEFEEEQFRIRTPDGMLNLGNFYGEARELHLTMGQVKERLSRLLTAEVDNTKAAVVLPGLRERQVVELQLNLRSELMDAGSGAPYTTVADELALVLVADHGATMSLMNGKDLQERGTTFEAEFAQAERRLLADGPAHLVELQPGAYKTEGRDDYEAPRFLLGKAHQSVVLKGEPVALFLSNFLVFVTGDADEAGLARIANEAQEAMKLPRTWKARPVRFHQGTWERFLPPPSSPLFATFDELRRNATAFDYEIQTEVLEEHVSKLPQDSVISRDEESFAAAAKLYKNEKTGRLFSNAAWGETIDTLLPVTDMVHLTASAADPKLARVLGFVSWKRLSEVMGPKLVPTKLWPPRFRARDFPTADELKRLAPVEEPMDALGG